jgi:hypothetical protein
MVRAWHGRGMASVNQTRPQCVNQMGKTHFKPLAARHGRGTAWARHAMCESAFKHPQERELCNFHTKLRLLLHTKSVCDRHKDQSVNLVWGKTICCYDDDYHDYCTTERISSKREIPLIIPSAKQRRVTTSIFFLYLHRAFSISKFLY